MTKSTTPVGPWIRRFLIEHLVGERNLARNTQRSYRDTFCQLMPFLAQQTGAAVDRMAVEDIVPEGVRLFLAHVEAKRQCSIRTRNQRLAAIHAFARFVGERSPEHIAWCADLIAVPFKRFDRATLTYLDKADMDALLAAPDRTRMIGRRDHALLLFLYNTGARASEAVSVAIGDYERRPDGTGSVKLVGKGGKSRCCPLWPLTVEALAALSGQRPVTERVFRNQVGQPLTRHGLYTIVRRHADTAFAKLKQVGGKRIGPHTIRHTTATHLLRAGVDINTIRAWLGHVSVDTTNVYAEIDLEAKAKMLAECGPFEPHTRSRARWKSDPKLMEFLRSL